MTDTQQFTIPEEITTGLAEFNRVEAGLAALRQTYDGKSYDVTTAKGMAEAKADRKAVRDVRYAVQNRRKDIKAPILAMGRQIDAYAGRLIDELSKIENPIDEAIKAEETRVQREKEEAERRDQERRAAIQRAIDELSAPALQIGGKTSAEIAEIGSALPDPESLDPEVFQHRLDEARQVLNGTIATLRDAYREARVKEDAAEAQAKALAEAQAEIARLRQAEQELQAMRQAQQEQEALRRAQEEQAAAKEVCAQQEPAQAEPQAAPDVPIAQTEVSPTAEAATLTPAQSEPEDEPTPDYMAIIEAVAEHFGVPRAVALGYLRQYEWRALQ